MSQPTSVPNPWEITSAFLYVIESPGQAEARIGYGEADMLAGIARLLGLEVIVRRVASYREFEQAIVELALKEKVLRPNAGAILHISAHGDETGIQFTNGEVSTWEKLAPLFYDANQLSGGTLVVCMSSCLGLSAEKMVVRPGPFYPYALLAGCRNKPTWPEAALGFATFYHRVAVGSKLTEAAQAMRAASGRSDFEIYDPETGERA